MAGAERSKHAFGCAMVDHVNPEETIEVPSVGGRPPRVLSRAILSEIIEPRVEEIFAFVGREIIESGFEDILGGGVVITGGSTVLDLMPELAEEVLGIPVRRGTPRKVGGLVDVVRHPKFATGVGLVHYGLESDQSQLFRIREEGLYQKVAQRMKQWFQDFF